MKLFISDFHLGSPLFNKTKELVALFNREDIDSIYILGDIFDSWEMDPLDIFYKYESLVTTLNFINKPVYIFMGNHDPKKELMEEIFFNLPVINGMGMDLCGRKLHISHGHEACTDKKMGKLVFFVQYYSERWFKLNPKALLRDMEIKFKRLINGGKEPPFTLSIEKEIYDTYKDEYDIIITGHTHVPKILKSPELIYVNTGCVINKPTYILVDKCSVKLEEL
jgi:UDP-2,3-diacylglucosamine pyrophosphatase LpxH